MKNFWKNIALITEKANMFNSPSQFPFPAKLPTTELVPTSFPSAGIFQTIYDGIICDNCEANPIRGIHFKVR